MSCKGCGISRFTVRSTLEGVKIKMVSWAAINKFEAFAMQSEICEDIQLCHHSISDCLAKFQVRQNLYIDELALTVFLLSR